MPPEVTAFLDVHVVAGALQHDDGVHRGVFGLQRIIDVLLERHHCTAAIATIGGDHHRRAAVEHAVLDRFGAEATKHDAVHGTDACASEHRDRGLGHHRHVNDDAVTFLHLVALQHVRKAAHIAVELLVGDRALFAGFAFPDDGGLRFACAIEMTVEAVFAHVELATDEPLRVRAFPVEHLLEGLAPGEFLRFAAEELVRALDRLVIHLLVLRHRADAGLFGKLRTRLEHTIFDEEALRRGGRGFRGGFGCFRGGFGCFRGGFSCFRGRFSCFRGRFGCFRGRFGGGFFAHEGSGKGAELTTERSGYMQRSLSGNREV